MNYTLLNNTKDHVFWCSGKNDNGSEIMRLQGSNGDLNLKGFLNMYNSSVPVSIQIKSGFMQTITPTGVLTSCSTNDKYTINLNASNYLIGSSSLGIGFGNTPAYPYPPAACITYTRINTNTPDMGKLDFNFVTSSTTKENIFSIQYSQINGTKPFIITDKIASILPSTFSAIVSTGTLSSCSQAKNYPICIYASTGSTSAQRAAISFVDSTGSTNQAAADIIYSRTDATNDIGKLDFNLSTSATLRENIISIRPTELNVNKNLNVNGNVGLGVAPGTYKLNVLGDSYVNGNEYVSGNFGIATLTPSYKLHCVGDAYVNGNEYVSGNFGIATFTPSYKLHCVGDSFLNGNVGIGTAPAT
jgi:hypothetical protein